MNAGYPWRSVVLVNLFDTVIKRRILPNNKRLGYECLACGRVFKRKHVRWVGQGWLCRDRCERAYKGLP